MLLDKNKTRRLRRKDARVTKLAGSVSAPPSSEQYHASLFEALRLSDPHIHELIRKEYDRIGSSIQLIAAENLCSPAVLAALGSVVQNKTTEGFVGARYHGGCRIVDEMEQLAVERAKETFGARYANVQPHSGTSANQIVLVALLNTGDRILSLAMDQGGHVSHGEKVSFGGKFFEVANYHVDRESFLLDYDAIADQARTFRPRLIICGASAYCRVIDFARFRAIAEEVGAYLLADISHIAGLAIAGAHPSPIDHAHFTTTSTYKPGGPRGGLILMGRDHDQPITVGSKTLSLSRLIDKTTFPGFQGTPCLNNIAAKAVFLRETLTEPYRARQIKIIDNARCLADQLAQLGYDILTGGTDNHMVMINISNSIPGLTGVIGQKSLEDCGIIVNMNRIPYDTKSPAVTAGLRLGTPIVTKNGMGPDQMKTIASLIDTVLRRIEPCGERRYKLDESLSKDIRNQTQQLCRQFPLQ